MPTTTLPYRHKDTLVQGQAQEGPGVRELLETHLGVEFRGSGPCYSVRCPWHDDRSPSLSVDDERGLFHCHACGKGGNGWMLAKELGVLPERGVIHPGSPREWVYNSSRMDAPRWSSPWLDGEEVDAEEVYYRRQSRDGRLAGVTPRDRLVAYRSWSGQEERAEAVEMCGKVGETLLCSEDGHESVYPFHCGDRLCARCRAREMKRTASNFERLLPEGAEISLLLGGFPVLGEVSPEVMVKAKDRLHQAFEKAEKKGSPWGVLPGMRPAKRDGVWWWMVLVAVVGSEAERLDTVFALAALGLEPLKPEMGPIPGPKALRQVVAFAAQGYEGELSFEEMELVEAVLHKRRLIQGRGGFYSKGVAKVKEIQARPPSPVPPSPRPIVSPRPPRLGGGNLRRCHTCGRWGHTGHDLIPLESCVWVKGHLYVRGCSPADQKMTSAVA